MRVIAIVASLLATTPVAVWTLRTQWLDAEWGVQNNTHYTDIEAARDPSLLTEFIASLDPAIIKECVAEYEASGAMDLDRLATCGDFDVYARYMRVTKFEAVKKFQYVLLHSSSKLEFDDRLAR